MAELGAGTGSGYPAALDTKQTFANATPELPDTNTRMDSEVLNDVLTAIINIETELGTDPAQAAVDVSTFLSAIPKANIPAAVAYEDEANTFTLAQTIQALLDAQQDIRFSGDISPAALVADQNDFNPTGLSTASTIRVDGGTADRDVTGLAGGADGRLIVFHNIGSNDITLVGQSASSVATNRFELAQSRLTIAPADTVLMRYDSTSSRWRLAAGAGGAGGARTFSFFIA